ncbi:hypothetical protein DV096_05285 [Bradymonadaceae bacterium TMQ3]|nr:hypothetical protein DV096_05285 [Bradymonadaceae bacterium TMQ3]TXC77277.1 protein kinase [Bradymonadales bacterium TMQ1]
MVVQPRVKIGEFIDDRYRLESLIHEGRWGSVFRASDLDLGDRPVAIRIFPMGEDGPADPTGFARQAAELRALQSDTIATPYAHGTIRGFPYIVTQWARGMPLDTYLKKQGLLSLKVTLPLMQQLLYALDTAHQVNLTHGILRPSKVMVAPRPGGPPLLSVVDFQIWKLYELSSGDEAFDESHLSRRLVRYMAPEILGERTLTPAADLYTVGLIAIEMLTGTPAYPEDHRIALIARQLAPEPPELPYFVDAGEGFRTFLSMLVTKDRDARHQNAATACDILNQQGERFVYEPPAIEPEPVPSSVVVSSEVETDDSPRRTPGLEMPSDPFMMSPESEVESDDAARAFAPVPASSDDAGNVDELFLSEESGLRSLSDGSALGIDTQSPLDFLSDDADVDDLFASELNFGQDDDPAPADTAAASRSASISIEEPVPEGLDELPSEAYNDIPDAVEVAPEPAITSATSAQPRPASPASGPIQPRPSRAGAHRTPTPGAKKSAPPLLGLGLIALALAGAAAFLLMSPTEVPRSARAEALEEQTPTEATHTLRVTTSPPALRVLLNGNSQGFSPVDLKLKASQFPVNIGARLNANDEQTRTLDAPLSELHFEFETP